MRRECHMSHYCPEDEIGRVGIFIFAGVIVRFARTGGEWEDGGPTAGRGLGLPPEVARLANLLELARAAMRRFLEERNEVTRLGLGRCAADCHEVREGEAPRPYTVMLVPRHR